MNLRKIDKFQMDDSIRMALKEDITSEDISTNAIYKNYRMAEISLYSKEDGILAGLDVFKRVFELFELLDNSVEFTEYKKDGDKVLNKDLILKIRADVKTILSAERTALNYLQRMSGIATYTRKMVEALDDKNILLLDTRKTTPNMRIFEKYAVRVGGGYNHRYNLSDAIMLKDNHINAAAGSITEAIKLAREYSPFIKKIEVEVEDLKGVEEAVAAGADIIMLDNMDIETTKKAIKIINKKAIIECSGNIDITNINRFKGLEIDYVSSGAITHSAKILDLSLKNLRYIDD
ncbi:carboxylating nicotinate-nucleotide diphosphorylase [Fusobacterium animalis]|uniref:carboxylating nicotinate-nucleotide diphosphorylase n=1 Tax=Fusobacterium animalis TaxID=76859 RepID=UPI0030D13273